MRVLPYGERAVLAELDTLDEVLALGGSLAAAAPPGIEEWVTAARTVLVRFDPSRTSAAAISDALRDLTGVDHRFGGPRASDAGSPVVIPTVYDGDDLADVAALTGLSVEAVVAAHLGPTYTVAFCGFTPGFGYLVGGDPVLAVPRLATPRTRVPAGSVAIAGEYSAVYPAATPGGWRLLGRTPLALWDAQREPPALLAPGTRVRFEAVRA